MNRIIIDMTDETGILAEDQLQIVNRLLQQAAEIEGISEDAELSVTFVDNQKIQEINRDYRNKDQATDVISFAMEEQGEGEVSIKGMDMPQVLGDIIISVPRAEEQALEYGHSFTRELGFLAVHGFLHLLGYDHMTPEDEAKMFTKQKEILDAYGLKREI
ncbi:MULTISPECIES: rRNA maturation RNase YbeY [Bacillaceae]|uniref:rRNA maturation RNase YbeY n=1 Tax=Bacillaceae TaxID=186817 RepID=UPI000C757A94|nr:MULTISPECIES: rRNA maturation RNase YbeY [Bacillaceae]PLR68176.1 rRNA maturation RNase YbeY [Bacillus sp. UMB0893]